MKCSQTLMRASTPTLTLNLTLTLVPNPNPDRNPKLNPAPTPDPARKPNCNPNAPGLQVAGVLKLWFSCLPEPVVPPELYDAMLRTQRHRGHEARVAGIQAVLRQCEHRVLQVLYPLMEVRSRTGLGQVRLG